MTRILLALSLAGSMFFSLPRLEPFTHADAADLNTAITGWAYAPHATGGRHIAIAGNRIFANNASLGGKAFDTLNSYSNDQYAQIVYHNTGTGYVGVGVRADTTDPNGTSSDTHDQGYFFECTAGDRFFGKTVAGSDSALGDDAGSPSDGDIIRIEASSTTITAKINGATIFSVTDVSLSSGAAWIMGEGNDPLSLGDDWEGGNLSGGAPTPKRLTLLGVGGHHRWPF